MQALFPLQSVRLFLVFFEAWAPSPSGAIQEVYYSFGYLSDGLVLPCCTEYLGYTVWHLKNVSSGPAPGHSRNFTSPFFLRQLIKSHTMKRSTSKYIVFACSTYETRMASQIPTTSSILTLLVVYLTCLEASSPG
ncbi:hypothetical protein V8C44DRAFT_345911 [Trichoderma aethiopicum]